MAKKSSINNNKKRIKKVKSLCAKRAQLKQKIYNKTIALEERFAAVIKLAKLPRNSARVRIRNRCELTGRARGYIRKFHLSRNMMRELSGQGLLPGVVKSSW